jgi:hypothetical protein
MNNDNLRDTIIPKSDQLNADDLIGISRTITVTKVTRGKTAEQPVIVEYEGGDGRPYKPCKSMRRVLIACWGDNGQDWAGRQMTLFADPEVKFGGVKVGGIRISHLSHIQADTSLLIAYAKGKRAPHPVKAIVLAGVDIKPKAPPTANTLTEDQVIEMAKAIKHHNIDENAFLERGGIASLKDMPMGKFKGAMAWIEANSKRESAE